MIGYDLGDSWFATVHESLNLDHSPTSLGWIRPAFQLWMSDALNVSQSSKWNGIIQENITILVQLFPK